MKEKNVIEEIQDVKEVNCELCDNEDIGDVFTDPIIMEQETFLNEDFARGIKLTSEYIGMYSSFISCGFSHKEAISFVATKFETDCSIELQKIQNEGAKFASAIARASE